MPDVIWGRAAYNRADAEARSPAGRLALRLADGEGGPYGLLSPLTRSLCTFAIKASPLVTGYFTLQPAVPRIQSTRRPHRDDRRR